MIYGQTHVIAYVPNRRADFEAKQSEIYERYPITNYADDEWEEGENYKRNIKKCGPDWEKVDVQFGFPSLIHSDTIRDIGYDFVEINVKPGVIEGFKDGFITKVKREYKDNGTIDATMLILDIESFYDDQEINTKIQRSQDVQVKFQARKDMVSQTVLKNRIAKRVGEHQCDDKTLHDPLMLKLTGLTEGEHYTLTGSPNVFQNRLRKEYIEGDLHGNGWTICLNRKFKNRKSISFLPNIIFNFFNFFSRP